MEDLDLNNFHSALELVDESIEGYQQTEDWPLEDEEPVVEALYTRMQNIVRNVAYMQAYKILRTELTPNCMQDPLMCLERDAIHLIPHKVYLQVFWTKEGLQH